MSKYYVYQYVRSNNTPYYIGKGCGHRAYKPHKRVCGQSLIPRDRSRIQIIQQGLTEQEAWDLEEALIKQHGKIKDGGILVNIRTGQTGGQTVTREQRLGKNNPMYKQDYITPWGIFESSRLAAEACPEYITSVTILNFCQKKNSTPISYLSACRSKGWVNESHVGMTPKQLGFAINTISGRKKK
jgi:hypothetical protein